MSEIEKLRNRLKAGEHVLQAEDDHLRGAAGATGSMTAEELQALLPEWQKRLRLRDWDIKLVVHDKNEKGKCGRMANSTSYHASVVEVVLNPETDFPTNTDPEVSLVHELLHVQGGHLTEWLGKKKRRRYYDEQERLVEMAAIALVTLKREAQAKEQLPA